MGGKNNKRVTDERLDQFGRAMVRASAADEREAEAVAASPFLYARLRTRIAAEQERREAGESWLTLLSVVWRSAPAMALMAVVAFVLFWSVNVGRQSPGVLSDEALLSDAGIEQVVFAERGTLSSDDVLATIYEDERENSR
ncbi:MAG TPA: hypothetical protein VF666_18025 [Pyrinomonadaceae bacterium]|jgi:hypothetical protein